MGLKLTKGRPTSKYQTYNIVFENGSYLVFTVEHHETYRAETLLNALNNRRVKNYSDIDSALKTKMIMSNIEHFIPKLGRAV